MTLPVEVLAREVLQLPTSDRVKLLDQVISSLDSEQDGHIRVLVVRSQHRDPAYGESRR